MNPPDASADQPRRSRFVAGMTRARLLARLREAQAPLSLRELALDLGLHASSVREQLAHLVDEEDVRIVRSAPSGRGRPALRYAAAPVVDAAAPYRELARVLADELAADPRRSERAVGAGERWGRSLVRDEPRGSVSGVTPADAQDRLIALLEAGGFAPEADESASTIRLRRCPFSPLAGEHAEVVCGVHLGLMRGALAELGAPLDGVRLDPFVEPDLCLAHVARSDDRVDRASHPPTPTERRP